MILISIYPWPSQAFDIPDQNRRKIFLIWTWTQDELFLCGGFNQDNSILQPSSSSLGDVCQIMMRLCCGDWLLCHDHCGDHCTVISHNWSLLIFTIIITTHSGNHWLFVLGQSTYRQPNEGLKDHSCRITLKVNLTQTVNVGCRPFIIRFYRVTT